MFPSAPEQSTGDNNSYCQGAIVTLWLSNFIVRHTDSLFTFRIETPMPSTSSMGFLMARKGIQLGRAVIARRRKNIRFPLRAFVTFWWDDIGGNVRQGKGESRNVSEQGVFVETLICPPVGSQTILAISIQRPENTSAQEIEFEGRVVRVEHHRRPPFVQALR